MGCSKGSDCVAVRPPCCAVFAFAGTAVSGSEQNPFPAGLANDIGNVLPILDPPSGPGNWPAYPLARGALIGALAVGVGTNIDVDLGEDKLVFQLLVDGADFGSPVEFTGLLTAGVSKARADFTAALAVQDSLLTLRVSFVSEEENNPPESVLRLTATAS